MLRSSSRGAGSCLFLAERPMHGLNTTEEVHVILLVVPGGFLDGINKMNAPAKRMEVPADAETVTYATVDLTETMKLFEQQAIHFLTPDEIRTEIPQYPL